MEAQPPEPAPASVAAAPPSGALQPAAEVALARRPAPGNALTPLVPAGLPLAGPRRTLWRLVLAAVLAAVPLLCIGGLAIGFHLYDRVTRPDRSTPAVAAYNYLQAYLNDGSADEASQFRCADATGLAAFESFWDSQKAFAAARDDAVSFSWLISDTPTTGDQATVAVVITQETMSKGREIGESKHAWSLLARKESDWRICGATPTG